MKNLLAKWLNRKGYEFEKIRKYLNLSPKEYRRLIVDLSKTVEQQMCARDFSGINYEHVPSVAMNKYRKAFYRKDADRFIGFVNDVKSGVKKMNAAAIYPHQLYQALRKSGMAKDGSFKIIPNDAIEAQWKSLPNYMEGSTERVFPMIDVSPSMKQYGGLPLDVSISLGVYISERNESIFKNMIMTFSENPTIEILKGDTFVERATQLRYANWGGTTNLEKAFEMLLATCFKHDVPQELMPTKLLVISDMQFDEASKIDQKALDMIREKYEDSGYDMPDIIFWNVRAEKNNVPAYVYDMGVGLVPGFSPSILKTILNGNVPEEKKKETPYELMMRALNDERYDCITI